MRLRCKPSCSRSAPRQPARIRRRADLRGPRDRALGSGRTCPGLPRRLSYRMLRRHAALSGSGSADGLCAAMRRGQSRRHRRGGADFISARRPRPSLPRSAACLSVTTWRQRLCRSGKHSTWSTMMMHFIRKSKIRSMAATLAALASPLILTQFANLPARAADYDVGSMHISQPWARATPKGAIVRRRLYDDHQQRHERRIGSAACRAMPRRNARSTA